MLHGHNPCFLPPVCLHYPHVTVHAWEEEVREEVNTSICLLYGSLLLGCVWYTTYVRVTTRNPTKTVGGWCQSVRYTTWPTAVYTLNTL